MSNRKKTDILAPMITRFRAMEDHIKDLSAQTVNQDIANCRIIAENGLAFALEVDQRAAELAEIGETLDQAECATAIGVSLRTMQYRKRLYKLFDVYEAKRRLEGDNGRHGFEYAISLIIDTIRNARVSSLQNSAASYNCEIPDHPDHLSITGDSLIELRKRADKSVHIIVTSPAYWPPRRAWKDGPGVIGLEPTLDEWIAHLVAVFHECKRVLRDDGTMWINIGDAYSRPAGKWCGDPEQQESRDVWHPGTTSVAPLGNILGIPFRLAFALQADGWIWRSRVVWHKIASRPESVKDRPSTDYEDVLIFTKQKDHYYYDGDLIRIPSSRVGPKLRRASWDTQYGGNKPSDILRNDRGRATYFENPLGRNAGCVWTIRPSSEYRGAHSATMPLELAERCIMVGCPDGGTALDPFAGAATTALAALGLGRKAISIEIDPGYSQEGRTRIAKAMMIDKTKPKSKTPPLPTVTYDLLFADPPWFYYNGSAPFGGVEKYYETMSDDELLDFPMRGLMHENSMLFMWTTGPQLDFAIRCIDAWGLAYRGVAFVWIKTKTDGTPFRARGVRPSIVKPTTEYVLVASPVARGRPLPISDETVCQTIFAPPSEHSRKPDEVMQRLERLYPAASRLELFARRAVKGWDSWGIEINRDDT